MFTTLIQNSLYTKENNVFNDSKPIKEKNRLLLFFTTDKTNVI